MKTLLTVDFDFFVPEDPFLDLAHKEDLFFLKTIWHARTHLIDQLKCNGQEQGFWKQLSSLMHMQTKDLFISDSHASVAQLLQQEDFNRVILIDAHHDCWLQEDANRVGCEDWACWWLQQNPYNHLIWIYPDWQDISAYPTPFHLYKQIHTTTDLQHIKNLTAQAIHVCRSGCWVPPWCDQTFITFVKDLQEQQPQLHTSMIQEDDWDALTPRM